LELISDAARRENNAVSSPEESYHSDDSDNPEFFRNYRTSSSSEEEEEDEDKDPEKEQELINRFNSGLSNVVSKDSEVTIRTSLLTIGRWCTLANMHKTKAIKDTIALISQFVPYDNIFKTQPDQMAHFIKQMVNSPFTLTAKFYCNSCLEPVTGSTSTCNNDCPEAQVALNIENDLEGVIKNLFEEHNLADLIDSYKETVRIKKSLGRNALTDIVDGAAYQIKNKARYDLCVVQRCQEYPVTQERKRALVWPTYLAIADIAPEARKRFNMVANVWFAYIKKDMHKFAQPFVDLMNKLQTQGVNWTHPRTKANMNSKVFLILSVSDAQSRGHMQNILPKTTLQGCSFCTIKGEKEENVIFYPYPTDRLILRTKETVVWNSLSLYRALTDEDQIKEREANKQPKPISLNGVCGFSCLSQLKNFDFVACFCPEYVQTCLEGVVRVQLLDIFCKRTKLPYDKSKFHQLVSKRMQLINGPHMALVKPEKLRSISRWSPTELRNWLLFFSLPCLDKIWPDQYLQHLALLVFAVHTLLSDQITPDQLGQTHSALQSYCKQYANLYGKTAQSLELHQLLHLSASVQNFGPLHLQSTFMFISQNKSMAAIMRQDGDTLSEEKKLAHVIKCLNSIQSLEIACVEPSKTEIVLQFSIETAKLPPHITNFLWQVPMVGQNVAGVKFYTQVKFKDIVYQAGELKGNPPCFVSYKGDSSQMRVTKVLYFCKLDNWEFFIGQRLELTDYKYKYEAVTVQHFVQYNEFQDLVWGLIMAIDKPLFSASVFEKVLCFPPNSFDLSPQDRITSELQTKAKY